ncbi:MAG: two-component sensor histidine kinase [Cycloclasticus sp. symbiont of Bathymodiolus heckerae]|nr:MAG: two-component sensor histidine kinase [Cycloclasticus sp. symbiont of Bathymodiolus heckerae]
MSLLATAEPIQKNLSLENAFHAFNEVSQHLTDSYQQLEQQVSVLGGELAKANSEKLQHLSDKEALAAQLEGLIEAIPGAVIVLDDKQNIIKANACARSWLGDDLLGLKWLNVQAQNLVSDESSDDQLRLNSGQVVAISATKLMGQSGEVVLLSDITQQQALYKQLEHKKKLAEMGEFSASLAHQIRTPLASALLYASQLNTDALTEEAKIKFSSKLLERLRLLNSQVTDMLNYSRSGQFAKASISLPLFMAHLEDLYRDKPVDFVWSDKPSIELYISKDSLIGAISNLLDNAIDAIGFDARVTCLFDLSDKSDLKIIVKDNGIGLTSAQQQRIFEPFYTNKPNGTGLGLAVVSDVVSAHGGDIQCVSDIGIGTTMEVRLPVVMPASIKKQARSV